MKKLLLVGILVSLFGVTSVMAEVVSCEMEKEEIIKLSEAIVMTNKEMSVVSQEMVLTEKREKEVLSKFKVLETKISELTMAVEAKQKAILVLEERAQLEKVRENQEKEATNEITEAKMSEAMREIKILEKNKEVAETEIKNLKSQVVRLSDGVKEERNQSTKAIGGLEGKLKLKINAVETLTADLAAKTIEADKAKARLDKSSAEFRLSMEAVEAKNKHQKGELEEKLSTVKKETEVCGAKLREKELTEIENEKMQQMSIIGIMIIMLIGIGWVFLGRKRNI